MSRTRVYITTGPQSGHAFEPTPTGLKEAAVKAAELSNAYPVRVTIVETCSAMPAPGLSFGDLLYAGFLERSRRPDPYGDPDSSIIVWKVVGNILFSNQRGEVYQQGDEVWWEK